MSSLVTSTRLPEAICIQIHICKGLTQAHRLEPPVVHKDVKPQNVMLSFKSNDIGLYSVRNKYDFLLSKLVLRSH